jgi:hypothetical protein
MTMNLHAAATRFSERLLRFFARDLPPDLQPWGDAMLAELPCVDGVAGPVLWALGGGIFLSKASFVRALTGNGLRSAGPPGIHPPSPTQKMAFLAALLSLGMLLSPVFREGIQTSLESWARWSPNVLNNLDEITAAAERQNDAPALAFAALHTRNMQKSAQLAERAVAKDKELTWVLTVVLARNASFLETSHSIPHKQQEIWVKELEQWDPDNATSYIWEAQTTRLGEGGKWPPSFAMALAPQDGEQLMHRKAWLAAMEKAFAAPRYDSYFDRRMRLERGAFLRMGTHSPLLVADGIFRQDWTSWTDIRLYSNLLLFQGDQALAAGHPEQAEAFYLSTEQFSARLYSGAKGGYEPMFSRGPLTDTHKRLLALYQRWPHPEKELRSKEILARLQAEREIYSNPRRIWEAVFGRITWMGIAVSVSSGLAVLSMAGTLLGIGYFFSRQWLGFRASRRLNALMDGAGKYGPFVLFASCVCLYFTYRPYAQLFHDYMYNPGGASSPERIKTFFELRYFPFEVQDWLVKIAPLHVLFWMAVIVVLSLIVLGFVWRWVKAARKPAAAATS